MYDYCIVGAGITGITAASILARELGKKVVVIEKRDHIGGNCYDYVNEHGILVHKYGPHIFHTRYKEVWEYLSQFTEWIPYVHRVLAYVDGKYVSFPINIKTLEQLFDRPFSEQEMRDWIEKEKVPIKNPKNAEEMVISRMGWFLYEKFFKHYTRKQWGVDPKELAPEVTARIPIRFNRDDRYFTDPYQGIPKNGYNAMFEKMLEHKNIEVVLNTDYKEYIDAISFKRLVYTGPIDQFFDNMFGGLPYRCLDFRHQVIEEELYQPAAVVNYPVEVSYTRVTEFKHFTKQDSKKTALCFEHPKDHLSEKDVYCYPFPVREALEKYSKYKRLSKKIKNTIFIGRLAEYKYLNMDECVKRGLDIKNFANTQADQNERFNYLGL